MIYFDTNVYLYAFSNNIDDKNQQEKSIELLEKSLKQKEIITSEVILYEYVFVAKKLGENRDDIQSYLNFLEKFIEPSFDVYRRALEIMNQKDAYRSSFDIFHLAFSEYHGCKKLITFDKGFNKLKDITDVEIVVL
ncbi:type II toxin-antitoxin system VapC family toxin [bacterium]|nr:type II toxin-antitoxin system VapC family toxin [bacterium]MBU1958506.1 type II toxin-antitoxin system VapC family toxin [bacterium]